MATLVGTLAPAALQPYMDPDDADTIACAFAPSQTIARGTIIGLISTSGATQNQAKPYASGNTDGTQIPIGALKYDIVVDANGLIVFGPSGATADLTRGFEKTAPVYTAGTFLESDLTGLDANAVAVLNAHEIGQGAYKCLVIP